MAQYRQRMAEDVVQYPMAPLLAAPPPSLLDADPDHVSLLARPDPLDCGFVLAGGVLAPLPPRVRLPHEGDEGDEDRPDDGLDADVAAT
jgi:hypothetical protein